MSTIITPEINYEVTIQTSWDVPRSSGNAITSSAPLTDAAREAARGAVVELREDLRRLSDS